MPSIQSALRRGLVAMQMRLGPKAAFAAGRRLSERGEYRDALDALSQARAQWQATRGADDPWTVRALIQGAYCKMRLATFREPTEDLKAALLWRAANPDAKDMPREVDLNKWAAWIPTSS